MTKVNRVLGDEFFNDLERYIKVAREADELLGAESSKKFLDEAISFIMVFVQKFPKS